jgi:hypothetical protein
MGIQIKIEDYTFGSEEAEVILASNLRELGDPRVIKKVGKLINRYCLLLRNISSIPDHSVRKEMLQLVRLKYMTRVDSFDLPPKIDSFLRNALTIYYRRALRR